MLKEVGKIYRAFRKESERIDALPETEELGHSLFNCTVCARWIQNNFLPRGVIKGYFHKDNSTAKIGDFSYGHRFSYC